MQYLVSHINRYALDFIDSVDEGHEEFGLFDAAEHQMEIFQVGFFLIVEPLAYDETEVVWKVALISRVGEDRRLAWVMERGKQWKRWVMGIAYLRADPFLWGSCRNQLP
jgi:hypothetical protein